MIRAAVIGAAGYTGGELLRLLLLHPRVHVASCISSSQAGKSIASVHQDLFAWQQLNFASAFDPADIDVAFLCGAHGESSSLIAKHGLQNSSLRLIDLSQDYRLDPDFVYGLPEAFASEIFGASRIANPGCFATAIQLALLPLAAAGLLPAEVHITGITGSTGAGQRLQETSHFSWRSGNVSVYKAFNHQHLAEIKHTLRRLQADFDGQLLFIPVRGAFTRGIFCSLHLKCSLSLVQIQRLFDDYYREAAFVHRLAGEIHLKQVINTNQALISLDTHGEYLHITACLDNLLKGASGQAVQNMNLAFDRPETEGLQLKPLSF